MRIFLRIVLSGKRHWPRLFFAFITMLLSGAVAILPTWSLKLIVDLIASGKWMSKQVELNLIPQQLLQYGFHPFSLVVHPEKLLNWIPLILLLIYLLDGVLNFVSVFNSRFFGVLVANDLREKAHEKILQLSLGQIRQRNSGDLVSCLTNDLNLVQSLLAEVMTALVKDSTSAIALGLWLLVTDWKLSLIGVITLPLLFVFISFLTKKLRKFANQGQQVTGELSSFISETVQGADIVQLFSIYKARQNQFLGKNIEFVKAWLKQLRTDALIGPFLGIIIALTIGSIILFGLKEVYAGHKTVGDFTSYIVGVVLLYQPVKRLIRANSQINQISGTCERLFSLMDTPSEIITITSTKVFKSSKKEFKLDFKNVDFAYQPEQPVLQNINFIITEGDQVALVGPSGGGKSSLVKLIPRLYDATAGVISVKGTNIKDWDLAELRQLMSFVPQDPFLFSGSLRENLLIAKPEASQKELDLALELAKVDFLDNIKDSLDGQVGERGFNLSGGQRQRIGIARAFLKNSPLLILDEPTSSLDQQSEELIKQSIAELMKNRTVIMVSHKLSSIKSFPRIVCMQAGQIVEEGSHNDLINNKNLYFQLVNAAQ